MSQVLSIVGVSETLRWYVVRTQARKEAFGFRNLERQGTGTLASVRVGRMEEVELRGALAPAVR